MMILPQGQGEVDQSLTPTFRSKSLTMLRADILAEGVSGELLLYPFDKTVFRKKKKLFYYVFLFYHHKSLTTFFCMCVIFTKCF